MSDTAFDIDPFRPPEIDGTGTDSTAAPNPVPEGRPGGGPRGRRPLASISARLSLLVLFGPILGLLAPTSPPAKACVGPPPHPVCGKNLTLALAGPPTQTLTGGGTVDVGALVFFSLLDFPAGLGACPLGPYTVDIDVTGSCTPGPDVSGQVSGVALAQGFQAIQVPIAVPAGPARQCTLSAIATVRLADGMELTETAENDLCVVDPAADMPALPRLGLELLGPPGAEIAREHPGDQASHTYRITNNDPDETFTGFLSADMEGESRMPGMSGPQPPGTGVFSISDPVQGDNFPIAFANDLYQGCVVLPSNPLDPAIPRIERPIVLPPGGSTDVTIYSRSWGMCADGSCSSSTVTVDGEFSDVSKGLACSGFVLAADSGQAPDYLWPDAGSVGTPTEPLDPSIPRLELETEPSPGVLLVRIFQMLELLLRVGGTPLPNAPIVTADLIDEERARIQLQYLGSFDEGVTLEVGAVVEFQGAIALDVRPIDGPTGFQDRYPSVEVLTRFDDGPFGAEESSLDSTVQISVTGLDSTGGRRAFEFDEISFRSGPQGPTVSADLGSGKIETLTGEDLIALEVSFDLRGFASLQPQLGFSFSDGFESGNVSRWSTSTP